MGWRKIKPRKTISKYQRRGRPVSAFAVPFGPGIEIWRSCRLLSSYAHITNKSPLGDRSFSCSAWLEPIIADFDTCGGKKKSGHGLTSRNRETTGEVFSDELKRLFSYAGKAGVDLLKGTWKLQYCTLTFARKMPTSDLPVRGNVPLLITVDDDVGVLALNEAAPETLGEQRHWVDGVGGCRQRFRLTRKNSQPSLQEQSQHS